MCRNEDCYERTTVGVKRKSEYCTSFFKLYGNINYYIILYYLLYKTMRIGYRKDTKKDITNEDMWDGTFSYVNGRTYIITIYNNTKLKSQA